MILRKIDAKQIVSLRINPIRLRSTILPPLINFTNVISLILLGCQTMDQIKACESYFPNLTSLSLWFNDEVNFSMISRKLNQLRGSIKRFEIRCRKIHCNHSLLFEPNKACTQNLTVDNLLLDVRHCNLLSMSECSYYFKSCFLTATTDLINYMPNIRYVCLIINKYALEQLIHFNQWATLMNYCRQLKKVTLQVMGNIQQDQQLTEDIVKIQKDLRNVRQSIKFQVTFV
jgi:hypothetical protein